MQLSTASTLTVHRISNPTNFLAVSHEVAVRTLTELPARTSERMICFCLKLL